MIREMSADELAGVASGLRSLAEQFRTRSEYFDGDITAADTFHGEAGRAWHGNRATTNLAVGADYVDAVRGMGPALSSIAGKLDAFATDAESIAGWLRPYEAVRAPPRRTASRASGRTRGGAGTS